MKETSDQVDNTVTKLDKDLTTGFLDADKAFEVLNGMKTYEMRV